jgi:Concanavalin A-like lectin/glucanases superfamily
MPDESILITVLKTIGSGALSELGSEGLSSLLSLIGFGDAEAIEAIENDLQVLLAGEQEIETQLSNITTELKDIETQVQWSTLIETVSSAVNDINSNYALLASLNADDTTTAQQIQEWALGTSSSNLGSELTLIYSTVENYQSGLNPDSPGLLATYAMMNVSAFLKDPNYGRGKFKAGDPIDIYYQQIQSYFSYLLGIEWKGVTLLSNAYMAAGEADLAQQAINDYNTHATTQCEIFLSNIESFTVSYAQDYSLMSLFANAEFNQMTLNPGGDPPFTYNGTDPIRRAGLFNDSLLGANTFYVRIWGGYGTGTYPFDTGTYINIQPFDPSGLISLDGSIPPSSALYSNFPNINGGSSNWSLMRFAWLGDTVGGGTYELTNNTEEGYPLLPYFNYNSGQAYPIANVMLNPSGQGSSYTTKNQVFVFTDPTPNYYYAVFTAATVLKLDGKTGYAEAKEGSDYKNKIQGEVGAGDFSIEAWVLPQEGATGTVVGNLQNTFSLNILKDNELEFLFLDYNVTEPSMVYRYGVTAAVPNLSDGNWHHVAAVRQGGSLQLYLDGQSLSCQEEQGNNLPIPFADFNAGGWNALLIGCSNGAASLIGFFIVTPTEVLVGRVLDVRLWNKALQQSDVEANMYTHVLASEQPDLAGNWLLDNGSITDETGNATGSLTGNANVVLEIGNRSYTIVSGENSSE